VTGSEVPVVLPADSHVHTQWSWDAIAGDMVATCARAVELGLPAVAFTEHIDITESQVPDTVLEAVAIAYPNHPLLEHTVDGAFTPPPFDAVGYLAMVEECRDRFPSLRILSGLEMGEPHRHGAVLANLLATGTFDRVLGSLHCVPFGESYAEPPALFAQEAPETVVRDYLAEIAAVAAIDTRFEILAHVDYPGRWWPESAGPFVIEDFEEEFRTALKATAASGRALELNTRLPHAEMLLRWWRDVGGSAISFGSDAHEPAALARGFRETTQLAEAHGFRPGRLPHELWGRG
jgi:histidinol-phosphatase (PHP family)